MTYDEARAKIRGSREHYGSQWKTHLDRYGPRAYFYELAGILGRLESLIVDDADAFFDIPPEAVMAEVQDKLLDLGNYASFIYEWIEIKKAEFEDRMFREQLP